MGSLLVNHEPASAAVVRKAITADLTGRIAESALDEIVLVASELVGNAIQHSAPRPGRRLGVEWDVDRSFATIRVSDAGGGAPCARSAGRDDPTGRGLSIVNAVSAEWGSFPTSDGGKYVWARVPLARSEFAAAQ